MQKVVIIYSAESPSLVDERLLVTQDDTLETVNLVGKTLRQLGYEVEIKPVFPSAIQDVRKIKSDLVFNLCEWTGKDYVFGVEVLKILERNKIPYTGTDARGYRWCSVKQEMKKMFKEFDIPTPKWMVYNGSRVKLARGMKFPVIVKPAWEHCSVGISQESVCENYQSLRLKISGLWKKFKQPILVEEFIDGNEYQVTAVEGNRNPVVLPPAEITFKKVKGFKPLLTFEGRWENSSEADLSEVGMFSGNEEKLNKLISLAKKGFRKLECKGYVRFDIREKKGKLYVLEVNVNPGIGWDLSYGMTVSAIAAGLDLGGFISLIVKSAKRSYISQPKFNLQTL